MRRVGVLPALVTLANGYCGLLAIFKTHDGDLYAASWLILLAMVFDVMDGKIARIAGSTSKFGAYLDSLCDAISFGVAPAFLAKAVASYAMPGLLHPKLLTILTALFAMGALLRLARYNLEHSSGEGMDQRSGPVTTFDGLPTPGAAGVLAGCVFAALDDRARVPMEWLLKVVPFLCPVLGFLMISRVPYVHFGNRFLQGRRDFVYLFGVAMTVALITLFPHETLAAGFLLYGASGPAGLPFRRRPLPEAAPQPDHEA
ncbi:MAG: CDP-alcohol phosphatidyltransferase family protein [Planctomycetaceae bacterium]